MSVRTDLAATLSTALPTFQVIGYPRTPDAVTGPTVALWQSMVRPWGDQWRVDLDLWVLHGGDDMERLEDALDANLDEVIAVLLDLPGLMWEQAERLALADIFHGYKITLTAAAKNGA